MANIGFIGTGAIAAAMVQGLAGKGHSIHVSERNAEMAAGLTATYTEVSSLPNQQVLEQSDVVILCLMKSVAEAQVPGLSFAPRHRVISVMVDVPYVSLQQLCAPAAEIAMAIPLPMIAKGGCPIPVFPASTAAQDLFADDNLILTQPSEQALNAHFAACALGAVVLSQLQCGADWLAGMTGDAAAAETYLSKMIAGYLNGFETGKPGQIAATLQVLSTEGGLNATLRTKVEQGGVLEDIETGLNGFRARLGLPSLT